MKRLVIILTLNSLCLFPITSFSQFREISGGELESKIFSNHQIGQPGYTGLFTKLIFQVEDYSLLSEHFSEIQNVLKEEFSFEKFHLVQDKEQLVIVYDKTKAKTDDFLAIFKEILKDKKVFLKDYLEFTLVRSID